MLLSSLPLLTHSRVFLYGQKGNHSSLQHSFFIYSTELSFYLKIPLLTQSDGFVFLDTIFVDVGLEAKGPR